MTYTLERVNRDKKIDWYHKWYNAGDYYKINECVRGELEKPQLVVSIPYKVESEVGKCRRGDGVEGDPICRSGIPDPWDEYLTATEELGKGKGIDISQTLKRDFDIMSRLTRNYHLYFGQGIPDPWKNQMRMEPVEPEANFESLKRDLKKYFADLLAGPGCRMYEKEKIRCPNCKRPFIILCKGNVMLKNDPPDAEVHGPNPTEEGPVAEVAGGEKAARPDTESGTGKAEKTTSFKDVGVETEIEVTQAKGEEVEVLRCGCKEDGICGCGTYGDKQCLGCPVCNPSAEGVKNRCECRRRRSSEQCSADRICSRNAEGRHTLPGNSQRRIHHSGPFLHRQSPHPGHPVHPGCKCSFIRNLDRDIGRSSPAGLYHGPHRRSVLPFFYNVSGACPCFPQQMIGFEEKSTDHCMELKLTCLKCEKRCNRRPRRCKLHSGTEKAETRKNKDRSRCECDRSAYGKAPDDGNEEELKTVERNSYVSVLNASTIDRRNRFSYPRDVAKEDNLGRVIDRLERWKTRPESRRIGLPSRKDEKTGMYQAEDYLRLIGIFGKDRWHRAECDDGRVDV